MTRVDRGAKCPAASSKALHPRLDEVPVFDRPRATSQVSTTRRDNIIACRAESGSSWFWILFFGERYGLFRVLLADQVHSCLIQLGAHLITLVGARDVTDGDLDAAAYGFYIDSRGGRQSTHLPGMRGMLPFLFGLIRAFCGRFLHGLLNGLHYRVRILARAQNQCKFIPKPLSCSGKIEVVAFDGKIIGEGNSATGRMPGVSPVAGFKQYRVKHSELGYFPGYAVDFHPVSDTNPIFAHENEPSEKAHNEIFERHGETCASKSQEGSKLCRRTENH